MSSVWEQKPKWFDGENKMKEKSGGKRKKVIWVIAFARTDTHPRPAKETSDM